MIEGHVDDDEVTIRLAVKGPGGRSLQIEAVIDTGFTNELSLTEHDIDRLELPFLGNAEATLADGSKTHVAIHSAEVMWDEESRRVVVVTTNSKPLVGMKLLRGFRVTMDVVPAGAVRIERLGNTV